MFIKSVKFKNYKQHRDLEIDLNSSVIALIGRNGSGKSNLMGGIEFALTGSHPGSNKGDLTTWGEKNGSVTVKISHAGRDYTIYRETSTSKATFNEEGKEEISGIREVNEAIDSIIADRDILTQIAFVNQAQMDSILFSRPAERSKAFQRLIGLQDANNVYEKLGNIISSMPGSVDYGSIIEDTYLAIKDVNAHIDSLKEELKGIESSISILGYDPNKIDLDISNKEELLKKINNYSNTFNKMREAKLALEVLDKYKPEGDIQDLPIMGDLKDKVNEIESRINSNKSLLDFIYTVLHALKEYDNASDNLLKLTELHSKEELVSKVGEYASNISKMQDELSAAKVELRDLNKLKRAIETAYENGVVAECHVCGSSVKEFTPDSIRRINELGREIDDLDNRIVIAQGAMNEANNYINVIKESEALVDTKLAEAKELNSNKPELLVLHPEYVDNPELLRNIIGKDSELLAEATDALEKFHARYFSIEAKNEAIIKFNNSRKEAVKRIESIDVISVDPEVKAVIESGTDVSKELYDLRELKNNYRSLEDQRLNKKRDIERVEKDLVTKKEALAEYSKKYEEEKKRVTKVEVLKTVRNWFHHSNGPGAVTSEILDRLSPTVNYFLNKLEAPFHVTPDKDNLTFRYTMTNSEIILEDQPTADSLSGAQKTILALSFRLACYHMFASKLGLLVLDEPLAHWDTENVGRFGELLQRLHTMVDEMGFQLIISTHHKEILPFCDAVRNI